MSTDERYRIGQRIVQLRKEKGMSQEQLSEKAGITQINISRIECGKYSPGLDVLSKIASALEHKLDFIENEKAD